MKKEEIVEQLATGRMSRRQFNKNLMALGATMVMMPMGSRMTQAARGDHPTVFTWEGWEVPELHAAYVAKYVNQLNQELYYYNSGSNGPAQSEELISSYGHSWHEE